MIHDIDSTVAVRERPSRAGSSCDPADSGRRKRVPDAAEHTDLLVPLFRGGELVYQTPPLEASREWVGEQLATLHPGIKRFLNPHAYPAGLSESLQALKKRLIGEARGETGKW